MDWVKSVFARLKASGAVNKDIIKLEQKFIRLAETAKKQRVKDEAKQGKGQYSIVKDAKNRDIVVLDRNIFDGITNLKKRAEALEDWILKNFGGTKHNTSDYFFVVMNERTFGKMPKGENPKVDVTVPHKVSEKQGVRRFARTALLIHRRLFIKQRIAFCICNMVDSLPILY